MHLHIIALDIPYPANYGGAIDMFYQVQSLSTLGVEISLHCFYDGRTAQRELNQYCREVYYYPRQTGLVANLSHLPYNVLGRRSEALMERLLQDDSPILFEGLHCCYYLSDPRLEKRQKFVRLCNIEHNYYTGIAKATSRWVSKCFHYIEAKRFRWFEPILTHATALLVISESEGRELEKYQIPVHFIPGIHEHNTLDELSQMGTHVLYHGNLSVAENEYVARRLVREVMSRLSFPCVVAGSNPPISLRQEIAPYPHIRLEANPSEERMLELQRQAQVCLMITHQATGFKLKLINSLFRSRHCLVNSAMTEGTGLGNLCHIGETSDELVQLCQELIRRPFTADDRAERQKILLPRYTNQYLGRSMCRIIFGQDSLERG